MRPLRLEVAGFTAFREPTVVDFTDADYFALVGPTGSGKSSVIDAMCFALYGKVPRLDLRSVEPIVSQGRNEARIRLDFAVGEETYTAVRLVRRLGQDRATTKEARLERGEEVLAGDADGVSQAVERLLGLGFAQFTRCVVLPQGEFARFMHDKPADRQELLVKLLDLGMYGRMQQRANQRAVTAETELTLQQRRLDEDLAYATPEALDDARMRLKVLEELRDRIDADEPTLERLREDVRRERETAAAARRALEALQGIRVPPDVEALASALTSAKAALGTVETAAEQAEQALTEAEAARAALPDATELQGALEAHEQLAGLDETLTATRAEVERLATAVADAAEAADAAGRQAHEAQHALEAARVKHRAQDLARVLVPGEPCPVCRQTVGTVPDVDVPEDLDVAPAAADEAVKVLKAAERALGKAQNEHAAAEATLRARTEQRAALAGRIAAHPDADAVRAGLAEVASADQRVAGARTAATEARSRATAARRAVEAAEETLTGARRDLAAARDRVADLSPPPLGHEDLAADWAALAAWAAEETERQRARAEAADTAAGAAEAEGKAIVAAHREACIDAGIEDVASPRDDCLKALERAKGLEERIGLALEEAERIRGEIGTLTERHQVARELSKHLKANAFERWVLGQALTALTDGATRILLELSSGQYSLTLDKHFNFAVIDHRNANLPRSARTLSGGETFLASLALALAMADRIAQLSANTAVRLESIFLDEGFGSLDAETLETVATAIESLGATERVVGIVTHVRDLAERVPVRFEVRKTPGTSVVEKVLA